MSIESFSPEGREQLMESALARARLMGHNYIDKSRLYRSMSRRIDEFDCPPVHSLELFLTEDCNLRCDYCFVEGKNTQNRMSEETAKKSIDFLIRESKEKKDLSILFFGGEPLLEFELIKKVVHYALDEVKKARKTIHFSMTTNGTLFDRDQAIFCKEHDIQYMLSIDGMKQDHDLHRKSTNKKSSFDMIKEKFATLKEIEPCQGARITPLPDTVSNLYRNVKYLVELGINDFTIGTAHGINWSQKEYQTYQEQMDKVVELYRTLKSQGESINLNIFKKPLNNGTGKTSPCAPSGRKKFGCRAGKGYLCVAPDGSLYGCSMLLSKNGLNGVYKIGDLWNGLDENRRKELIILNYNRDSKCLNCTNSRVCGGGCIGNNYKLTGRFISADKRTCLDVAAEVKIMERFRNG